MGPVPNLDVEGWAGAVLPTPQDPILPHRGGIDPLRLNPSVKGRGSGLVSRDPIPAHGGSSVSPPRTQSQ